MTVGSRVNPNFPIPGIDQSSRGFRENFSTIKNEIENLQGKNIQLVGSLISDPIQIGAEEGDIIIPVNVSLTNVQAAGSNLSVQYNLNNRIAGSSVFINNGLVGIGTNAPRRALDVRGNVVIQSGSGNTRLFIGNNFETRVTDYSTVMLVNNSNLIVIDSSNLSVGIGTSPRATFDVQTADIDGFILRNNRNNSDNGMRFTTLAENSTIGMILEQRYSNKVGGMRVDQRGNLSLHVNESMDASLSDASRVLVITTNNNVGIGSMVPRNQLDVKGNTSVTGKMMVTGNINISNTSQISGIFFSDGTYQTTAASGSGGSGGGTVPLSFICYANGQPLASQTLMRFVVKEAFMLVSSPTECVATAEVPALTGADFYLLKDNSIVGTFTFSTGSDVGVFTLPVDTTFDVDSIFTLLTAASVDSSVANIGFTFKGDRV